MTNAILLRIIIGSDRRPETKQGIEGKIDRFRYIYIRYIRSGMVRVRVRPLGIGLRLPVTGCIPVVDPCTG